MLHPKQRTGRSSGQKHIVFFGSFQCVVQHPCCTATSVVCTFSRCRVWEFSHWVTPCRFGGWGQNFHWVQCSILTPTSRQRPASPMRKPHLSFSGLRPQNSFTAQSTELCGYVVAVQEALRASRFNQQRSSQSRPVCAPKLEALCFLHLQARWNEMARHPPFWTLPLRLFTPCLAISSQT